MKVVSYALLLGLFYVPISLADTPAEGVDTQIVTKEVIKQGALKKCTHLLPEGHKYTISIIGTSDKTTKDNSKQFTGQFDVSDETQKPLDEKRKEQVKPFIECVKNTVL
ncbi:hypothetical protein [Xenorhabdus innexi]|uniref:Uncharacterized protein n=1 Tax=Xenorhabdus innexi TaxID=290109 RepID=A0A1N6MVE7_9GAMM|nr:hypothetical protein [Xenorhabdus innexi]PHM38285.1 hypothetical protein Xinn_00399 [Xenorhabdus innexi]SIP72826.1 conserved exported hypothetical protein [Xenorhabdus innexi]